VNLGTERPYSVLEVIAAFEHASGITIPYEFVGRRSGDLAEYFANAQLAKHILDWVAQHDLDRMCRDAWRFYQYSRDSVS
jgi:UDP-glucose 4-epimerase